jgi:hypothetical protein
MSACGLYLRRSARFSLLRRGVFSAGDVSHRRLRLRASGMWRHGRGRSAVIDRPKARRRGDGVLLSFRHGDAMGGGVVGPVGRSPGDGGEAEGTTSSPLRSPIRVGDSVHPARSAAVTAAMPKRAATLFMTHPPSLDGDGKTRASETSDEPRRACTPAWRCIGSASARTWRSPCGQSPARRGSIGNEYPGINEARRAIVRAEGRFIATWHRAAASDTARRWRVRPRRSSDPAVGGAVGAAASIRCAGWHRRPRRRRHLESAAGARAARAAPASAALAPKAALIRCWHDARSVATWSCVL